MRPINVLQGSDDWERLRQGVPTASQFHRIITAARGQLSASWKGYAAELIAKTLGVYVEPLPSFWMEWGVENEPYAVAAYEQMNGVKTDVVGFIWPDDHERYGCSPDRLVGEDGLLEVKCPKPETLIEYHVNGVFPDDYKQQVQGQLLITGRDWCDFLAFHPHLAPFQVRVDRDNAYIAKMMVALDEFCESMDELRSKLQGIDRAVDVSITSDYQPISYASREMEL